MRVLLFILALLPLTSNATLVEVRWFGTVDRPTSNNVLPPGAWYQLGDAISGTFLINTDLAPGNSNFVNSGAPQLGSSLDQVQFWDEPGNDSASIIDWESRYLNDGFGNVLSLTEMALVAFSGSDFLSSLSLEQDFDLIAGDSMAFGTGELLSQAWWSINYETVYPRETYAHFRLDRVTARVPEPETLSLAAIGMLSLLVVGARRRKGAN